MKKQVTIEMDESYLGFYEEKAYNYDSSLEKVIEDVLVRKVEDTLFDDGTRCLLNEMKKDFKR